MKRMTTPYATIRPGIDFAAFARYLELIRHADETGIPLAMSPAAIMAFEDAGAVVDMETGWIDWPDGIAATNMAVAMDANGRA